jgi:hypothetical protein
MTTDINALRKERDHLQMWRTAGLSNQDKERLAWLNGFFSAEATDFSVKDDTTGAAAPVVAPSGTLYAPEKKENAVTVEAKPDHICALPQPLTVEGVNHEEAIESHRKIALDSLFKCECGRWYVRDQYTYKREFTHFWRGVELWDFKLRRRIKWLEAEEKGRRIIAMIDGGIDVE